jgi:hypothetical protein
MSVKHLSYRLSILGQIELHENPTKWIYRTMWQVATPSLLVDEISALHIIPCALIVLVEVTTPMPTVLIIIY